MKKGQNRNYSKPAFQTGLSHKVSYDQLLAHLKSLSQTEKKAINMCKKRKKK